LTIPNLVSLSRLALAIAFIFVTSRTAQAVIIVVAAATDFVDGFVARRFGQRSKLGEVLDPVTDKLFVLTVLVTLFARRVLALSDVLILLTRDFYNTGAFIVARARGMKLRFKARMSGKVVTVLQIAALLAFLLLPSWSRAMLGIVFLASVYSIIDYTRAGLRDLRRPAGPA
jgi:CDP-diacylglycerol--glycerol-3-phosphate 3-phosphatidyltransferase/cardiolipin synthase